MIDVTRSPFNGIGRYSWGLLEKLSRTDKDNSYCGLVHPGWEEYSDKYNIRLSDVLEIKSQPETIAEINNLSYEIESQSDLFIATNFSTYHLIEKIPVVQVVHDLIYVLHPEWQPTYSDLINKYGEKRVKTVVEDLLSMVNRYLARISDEWVIDSSAITFPAVSLISKAYQAIFAYYIHNAAGIIAVSYSVSAKMSRYYSNLFRMITMRHDLPTYLDGNEISDKKS